MIGSFKEFIVLKNLGKSEINADKILNINVQVGGALFSRVTVTVCIYSLWCRPSQSRAAAAAAAAALAATPRIEHEIFVILLMATAGNLKIRT